MQKLTFEIQTDKKQVEKSAEELAKEKMKLDIYVKRAKKDLEDANKTFDSLKQQMSEQDSQQDKVCMTLRE